jgi:hypothetical protein
MLLKSQLLSGDPKLEAAALSDPAHIAPGARGTHVAKIQSALILLNNAALIADGVYGQATADAVLAYKRRRHIINPAYQTQADNIVGKMTIASLDRELLSKEAEPVEPAGPVRFEVLAPIQPYRSPRHVDALERHALTAMTSAKLNVLGSPSFPPGMTLSPSTLKLHRNDVGIVRVHNGVGKELECSDRSIATMAPLDLSANAHTLTRVKITRDPEDIRVFGHGAGTVSISVVSKSRLNFDPFLKVVVKQNVGVFFHFVDGRPGVKTSRKATEVAGVLRTMNTIYDNSDANFTFVEAGSNPALSLPQVGGSIGAVRIRRSGGGPDWDALTAAQKPSAFINVFFVNQIMDMTDMGAPVLNDVLAITSRPPGDTPCFMCQRILPVPRSARRWHMKQGMRSARTMIKVTRRR